jgi:hypothetical protein
MARDGRATGIPSPELDGGDDTETEEALSAFMPEASFAENITKGTPTPRTSRIFRLLTSRFSTLQVYSHAFAGLVATT